MPAKSKAAAPKSSSANSGLEATAKRGIAFLKIEGLRLIVSAANDNKSNSARVMQFKHPAALCMAEFDLANRRFFSSPREKRAFESASWTKTSSLS